MLGRPGCGAAGVLPGRYQAVVSAGPYNGFGACGLTEGGEVLCWERDVGMRTVGPPAHYVAASASTSHMCALTEGEEVVCWGGNRNGEADAPAGRYTAISAGSINFEGSASTSCALDEAGGIVCWGARPRIDHAPTGRYAAITTSGSRHCALTDDGELVCWVYYGIVDAPPGRYRAVDANWLHTCALTLAGEAVCWADTTPFSRRPQLRQAGTPPSASALSTPARCPKRVKRCAGSPCDL